MGCQLERPQSLQLCFWVSGHKPVALKPMTLSGQMGLTNVVDIGFAMQRASLPRNHGWKRKEHAVLILASRNRICQLSSSFQSYSFSEQKLVLERKQHQNRRSSHVIVTGFHYPRNVEDLGNFPYNSSLSGKDLSF